MVIQKHKSVKYLFVAAVLLVASMFSINLGTTEINAISKACQDSPECMEAVEREKQASRNAAEAAQTANSYENKVRELNLQIAIQETKIAESEVQIDQLSQEIEEKEVILHDEQEALASMLIKNHFNEEAEPIKILASSTSISDLAEKKAREEVARRQISVTANAVKEHKEQLESDRVAVENMLFEQQQTLNALAVTRYEQQELVTKYKDDAEAYEKEAEAAKEAKLAAERRQHPPATHKPFVCRRCGRTA